MSLQVKDSKALHTQKDVAKFQRDLQAATQSKRANAGLFLSLGARYPGKAPLQLTIEHGMPVCYASRAADDALPAPCLVEFAFRALAEAWPLICRQRGEGVQLTIQAAAEQFEEQLNHCEALSKQIAKISKTAKSLAVDVKHLEKIRDSLVAGVECVRVNHPSLVPEAPEDVASEREAEDPWQSEGAENFVAAIREAKRGSRYPKEGEVAFEGEALTFYKKFPGLFKAGVDRVKKEVVHGKKRKAEDAAPASNEEEDVDEAGRERNL